MIAGFSGALFRASYRWAVPLVALVALLVGPVRAAGPDTFVFAWSGPISVGYAPVAFAEELGYAKAENLDIQTVTLDGSGVAIPQLMNGSIATAFLTLDPLIVARQPGKPNFDYRFAYNVLRNSIWEISVLDSSPIKSIKDLAGKTIGVGALSFGNIAMTKAILQQAGVDPNGVQFVAVGVGVPAIQALKTGKIDAMNLFDIVDEEARLEGTKVRLLPLPAQFSGVSSHALPYSNKYMRDHPDLVVKFGRIFAEGTVACNANPVGCLHAYWKHYPELKPAGSEADAIKVTLPVLQVRLANMVQWQPGEAHKFGSFSDKDWNAWITSLKVGGQITVVPPMDSLYTNQFVDGFNQFDAGSVARAAKAYKG